MRKHLVLTYNLQIQKLVSEESLKCSGIRTGHWPYKHSQHGASSQPYAIIPPYTREKHLQAAIVLLPSDLANYQAETNFLADKQSVGYTSQILGLTEYDTRES